MGVKSNMSKGVGRSITKRIAPTISSAAPGMTGGFVREALRLAVDGVGPLPPAEESAEKVLAKNNGNLQKAVHDVIELHVRMAGAQGFVTNLGGLVTAAVAIPANITGLALIQSRMIAEIAHLHGYPLSDGRTRLAVLAMLLGEDDLAKLVKRRVLPAPPMALATAQAHDPMLERTLAAEVAGELLGRVAGKRIATTVGRRVPLVGGLVGAGTDGFTTWRLGRYAAKELLPRKRG